MVPLVTAETLAVAFLAILVVGLLRSHAEVLAQLHEFEHSTGRSSTNGTEAVPVARQDFSAPTIMGESVLRERAELVFGTGTGHVLLAFLTSGCSTCAVFWDRFNTLAPLTEFPIPLDPLIIVRDRREESISRLRRAAAIDELDLVFSTSAWRDYEIPSSPYFVLINRATGTIVGEGQANSWERTVSLLTDAIMDEADDAVARSPGREDIAHVHQDAAPTTPTVAQRV